MKFHKFFLPVFFLSFYLFVICLPANLTHAGINEWTPIGPEGSEVYDLAIYPKDPNILFAVFKDGLFKSTDGGVNWYLLETELTGIKALTIDSSNPNVLYARVYVPAPPCTGWCVVFPDLYGGTSLFKSEDGGINWYKLTGVSGVRFVAINPIDANIIYAATYHGIFKSVDGGRSWNQTTFGDFPASTVAVDTSNPDIVYAATWSEYGWNNSVFKSTNGGSSWSQTGLINTDVYTLAINPVNPEIIYAATRTGVFKTTDGGLTWNSVGNGQITSLVGTIAIDPVNPNIIYAGTGDSFGHGSGVFKSTDDGANWALLDTGLLPWATVKEFAIDPVNPDVVHVATHKGMFRSIDAGDHWTPIYTGLPMANVPVVIVTIDPLNPSTIYAISNSPTTPAFLYKSTNSGTTWKPVNPGWPAVYECCIDNLTIDPIDPDIIYTGSSWRIEAHKSSDGGTNWSSIYIRPSGLPTSMWPSDIRTIVTDPLNSGTIYAVTDKGVFKSGDGGSNWIQNNNGLTDVDVQNLAIDPINPNIIYVGTSKEGVFKSIDGGANWNFAGLKNLYRISLAIDPMNPSIIYAWSSMSWEGVFKSTDGGDNWNSINTGLSNTEVGSLTIDPLNPNIIYAGTMGGGVFKSTDQGSNWIAINYGLDDLSVQTLAVDPSDPRTLYAGTSTGAFKISQVTASQPSNPSPQNGFLGGSAISALTWQACLYAESYDVFFGTLPDPPFVSTITNTSYPLPRLSPNKTYYWKIVAKTACGESTPGPIWSFSTAISSPPTNVSASDGTYADRVEVSWLASPGATSYRVYRATSFNTWPIKILLGTTSGTLFNDATAKPGITYYYWVKASNTYGTSRPSSHDAGYRSDGAPSPTISLVSPSGGETLAAGTTQTIRWSYSENPGPYVRIELLKGGAVNRVIRTIAWKGNGGSGSFKWTIPANQAPGTDYRIRVTSTTYAGCTDTSDGDFTIADPTITVVSPNSEEMWSAGSMQTILWNYTGNPGAYVKIELLKGGVVSRTIASFASKGSGGSGSRSWKIPLNQAPGTDYSIRVTSTSNNSYSDTSDSNFTISK